MFQVSSSDDSGSVFDDVEDDAEDADTGVDNARISNRRFFRNAVALNRHSSP